MVLKLVELVVAPRGTVYEKRKLRVALNLCAPTKPPSRETRLYVSPLRGPCTCHATPPAAHRRAPATRCGLYSRERRTRVL